jgi:hypothetical protein
MLSSDPGDQEKINDDIGCGTNYHRSQLQNLEHSLVPKRARC